MISVLYGGGFPLALVQLSVFYYTAGCILHYIVPRIFPVVSVQEHERRPGDVQRDCLHSLGVAPLSQRCSSSIPVYHHGAFTQTMNLVKVYQAFLGAVCRSNSSQSCSMDPL